MRSRTAVPIATAAFAIAALAIQGPALALETPTTGQPGAPNTTCFSSPATAQSPGNAAGAPGSPFNTSGVSGAHYAGSTGTPSLANANSSAAISQYDVACRNATAH
jgi:hypothetical protein